MDDNLISPPTFTSACLDSTICSGLGTNFSRARDLCRRLFPLCLHLHFPLDCPLQSFSPSLPSFPYGTTTQHEPIRTRAIVSTAEFAKSRSLWSASTARPYRLAGATRSGKMRLGVHLLRRLSAAFAGMLPPQRHATIQLPMKQQVSRKYESHPLTSGALQFRHQNLCHRPNPVAWRSSQRRPCRKRIQKWTKSIASGLT
jgi:hypothetical protein